MPEPTNPDPRPQGHPRRAPALLAWFAGLAGLLLALAWLTLRPTSASPGMTLNISTNHALVLIKTTHGRSHEAPTHWYEPLQRLGERITRAGNNPPPSGAMTFQTEQSALGLWFRDEPSTQPNGISQPVAPSLTALFGPRDRIAGHGFANPASGSWSTVLLLDHFPRRLPAFDVEVLTPNPAKGSLGTLRIQNPAPSPDAGWVASKLPATLGEPGSRLTVHDLAVTGSGKTSASGSRWTRLTTSVEWNQPSGDKTLRIVGAEVIDPGGNRQDLLTTLKARSTTGTNRLSTLGFLFFDEPVWELRLFTAPDAAQTQPSGSFTVGPMPTGSPATTQAKARSGPVDIPRIRVQQWFEDIDGVAATKWLVHMVQSAQTNWWAELIDVMDDQGRSWKPTFVPAHPTSQAERQSLVMLEKPPDLDRQPTNFTAHFRVWPVQVHTLRLRPRFVSDGLLPGELPFPLSPASASGATPTPWGSPPGRPRETGAAGPAR